jgi:N-acetylmuramoyl-L-alanine amidase
MKIHREPSPNSSAREGKPLAIVVHYTAAGHAGGSIRWLCATQSRASAHYVIARNGRVTELVHPDRAAWHAGIAELAIGGECYSDVNDRTIGIELANHGLLYRDQTGAFWWSIGRNRYRYAQDTEPVFATLRWDTGHEVEGYWEPYHEAQLKALERMVFDLGELYPETIGHLVGHEEIGMPLGRKLDPGPLFPWDRIARTLPRRTSGRSRQ